MDCILVRYGEIATKARPTRRRWEGMLMGNIRASLLECRIRRIEGRIVVEGGGDYGKLNLVFGITSYSPAFRTGANMDAICRKALEIFRAKKKEMKIKIPAFRISARRLSKDFASQSQEVNSIVGKYILDNEPSSVSLKRHDIDIGIEIEREAYLFTEKIEGLGGIPVGVQGSVFCNLKNEEDACAALLMLKRGCTLVVDGKEELKNLLEPFSPNHKIHIGKAERASGIVTGDRFGTLDLESMKERTLPIYTPLIGLTEDEIERLKRMIFTKI